MRPSSSSSSSKATTASASCLPPSGRAGDLGELALEARLEGDRFGLRLGRGRPSAPANPCPGRGRRGSIPAGRRAAAVGGLGGGGLSRRRSRRYRLGHAWIPDWRRQLGSAHPIRACIAASSNWPSTGPRQRDASRQQIAADRRLSPSCTDRRADDARLSSN